VTTVRVLRTAKATLSRAFYLDEVATSATGSVGVAITREDGTAVEGGNAAGPDTNNVYSYAFGGRDVLDNLVVTWTATVGGDAIVLDQDVIEVVGGFYFSLTEGRAQDPALASTAKFPLADLMDRRIEAEDTAELICGQAFVPRFRRATLNGRGNAALMMPDPWIRKVRSVQVGSTVFSPTQLAGVGFSDAGMLYLSQGWIPGVPAGIKNIVIEYEHGRDRPPSTIRRASLTHFKSLMLRGRSNLPDNAERAVTVDAQGGSVVYGSPTPEKTGLPTVDAIYGAFPSPRPGFG
jgi:hypothetical protein